MMDKKHISESIFDALLGQAVVDNFYEDYNALPSLTELSKEYTFSEKHEKRMKELFAIENRRDRFNKVVRIIRRIAAVFLIIVTLFTGLLMLNPSVRASVTETIISWQREFVKFFPSYTEAEGSNAVPTYIPDGFHEIHSEVINDTTLILYTNENGEEIFFLVDSATGSLYVDNEDAAYEVLDIEGITYHILSSLKSDGENTIIWEHNGWRYVLRSSLYYEALLKMALSLE